MRCHKKKRDGKQCRACALTGNKYCALHAEPGKAAELGSKGGRRKASSEVPADGTPTAAEPPKTADQVRDVLADTVAQIQMKKMDPKTANALAYVGTALLRAIEVSSLESRLAALEVRSQRDLDNADS